MKNKKSCETAKPKKTLKAYFEEYDFFDDHNCKISYKELEKLNNDTSIIFATNDTRFSRKVTVDNITDLLKDLYPNNDEYTINVYKYVNLAPGQGDLFIHVHNIIEESLEDLDLIRFIQYIQMIKKKDL